MLLALTLSSVLRAVVALVAALIILKVGSKVLGGFARPVPEPPDPGELRKVRLTYRCSARRTWIS